LKNLIKRQLRERFFVTPKSGMNFSGVLIDEDRNHYVFAAVKVNPPDDDPQPVEGDVYIERGNVAYLQRLPHVDS
jgi:hypothetical protein